LSLEDSFVTATIELQVLPTDVSGLCGTEKRKGITEFVRATKTTRFD
jgi:hypothetical protein